MSNETKKVGKIRAVLKNEEGNLQEVEFESGRVDTVDWVKACPRKNVPLTAYEEYDAFNPPDHLGQYVILRNVDFDKGWGDEGVRRVTLIDEIISQINHAYLGVPDVFKKHLEPKQVAQLDNANNILEWTAHRNGYAICNMHAIFTGNENPPRTFDCQILVDGEMIFRHSEAIGRTTYNMTQMIPIKRGNRIRIVPSGNMPEHRGGASIYFVPPVPLTMTRFDRQYEEANKYRFNFKFNDTDIFNIHNSWRIWNDDTMFGEASFNENLITNASNNQPIVGNFILEIFIDDPNYIHTHNPSGMVGTSSRVLTLPANLWNNPLDTDLTDVELNLFSTGTHHYDLAIRFFKKQAAFSEIFIEVKLNKKEIGFLGH